MEKNEIEIFWSSVLRIISLFKSFDTQFWTTTASLTFKKTNLLKYKISFPSVYITFCLHDHHMSWSEAWDLQKRISREKMRVTRNLHDSLFYIKNSISTSFTLPECFSKRSAVKWARVWSVCYVLIYNLSLSLHHDKSNCFGICFVFSDILMHCRWVLWMVARIKAVDEVLL